MSRIKATTLQSYGCGLLWTASQAQSGGTPSTIWSDNGTNFVGAEKELLACIKSWNGMAPTIFAHKGVTWNFNPLGAPHHGGS